MKKFITIALAVAVLFSFAACQPTYKTVIGMSATTDKTNYLVGQSIDLSSVDVTVRYSDGSSDTFTGEDVTYMGPAKFTLTDAAAASTTVTFAYGSMNISDSSTITPVATLVLSIHTPKTVELSNLPTTGTVGTSAADIDFSEVSAIVTDAAGNTYEVPANALILTPTVTNAEGEQEVTACTATVYGMYAEVKGIEDWKVTLSASSTTYEETKFSDIEVTVEYFDSTDAKQDKAWIGDDVTITVKAVDTNGNKKTLDYATTVSADDYIATESTASISVGKDAKSIIITAVQNGKVVKKTATIEKGTDYVESITSVANNESYEAGATIPTADLEVTCVWASGENTPYDGTITFAGDGKAPATTGDVTIFCSYGKDNAQVSQQNVSITVK